MFCLVDLLIILITHKHNEEIYHYDLLFLLNGVFFLFLVV